MNTIAVPYTGWESHELVRVSRELVKANISPQVRLYGREPITTTEIELSGTVVDSVWNKYDRGIIIQTEDGGKYKAGGTNTTSSIATQLALFTNVPINFWGYPISNNELIKILKYSDLETFQDWNTLNKRITLTLRLSELLQTMRRRFYTRTPHRLKDLEGFLSSANSEIQSDFPNQESWNELIVKYSEFRSSELPDEFKQGFCGILSLVDHPCTLIPLSKLLEDENPEIRREAALAYRAKEELLQNLTPVMPHLVTASIRTVTRCLQLDKDESTRVYVTEDLGYFADKESVQVLITSLENDKDEHVRWASAVSLARYDDPRLTFIPLLEALDRDASITVQRSTMLGLGRILARIRAEPFIIDNVDNHLEKLEVMLHDRIAMMASQPALAAYAAYAIGELPNPAPELINKLIEALRTDIPFEIRSNATLALTRHFGSLLKSENQTEFAVRFLEENLNIERPSNYPARAYYDWFLEYAGELLVKLEARELAARYYQKAAIVFSHVPWRANYYAGIAEYEFAEFWFKQGELSRVLSALERSVKLFEDINLMGNGQVRSEKTKVGIEFRVNMAEARRAMILAISEWRSPFSSDENSQFISEMFNEAARKYFNVLRAEIESETGIYRPDHKTLSRAELSLVRALTSLVSVGLKVEYLSHCLSKNEPENILNRALGQVDAEINKYSSFALDTQSKSLLNISEQLKALLSKVYIEIRTTTRPLSAILGNFTWDIKQSFMRPLPTPAVECRIIGPGQAVVNLLLEGSTTGKGTDDDPYLFPSDKRLIFRAVIDVIQRAKNEQLIFRDHNPPPGLSERHWVVHVHEGTFPISIDYGLISPAESANCFEFTLEFRNSGCSDPVFHQRIWVKIFDPKKGTVTSKDGFRKTKSKQSKTKPSVDKNNSLQSPGPVFNIQGDMHIGRDLVGGDQGNYGMTASNDDLRAELLKLASIIKALKSHPHMQPTLIPQLNELGVITLEAIEDVRKEKVNFQLLRKILDYANDLVGRFDISLDDVVNMKNLLVTLSSITGNISKN